MTKYVNIGSNPGGEQSFSALVLSASGFLFGLLLSMLAASQYVAHVNGDLEAWVGRYLMYGLLSIASFYGSARVLCSERSIACDILSTAGVTLGGFWMGHSVAIVDVIDGRLAFTNAALTVLAMTAVVLALSKIGRTYLRWM